MPRNIVEFNHEEIQQLIRDEVVNLGRAPETANIVVNLKHVRRRGKPGEFSAIVTIEPEA